MAESATAFANKTVIVTGSASGIGFATTTLLLAAGASVFGIDVSPAPPALSSSRKYNHHVADLSRRESIPAAVAACQFVYGPEIHVLLNVAGISDHMSSVDTLTDGDWDRVIAINLTAPVLLMRAVLPAMLPCGGSIVNVCSTASFSGGVAGVAYTSAKHGLLGATRNVAYRFMKDGIRCNAVCPGGTATNIAASMEQGRMDLAAMQVYARSLAARGIDVRTGDGVLAAGQVAQAVVFLASNAASGISGTEVAVDAGGCAV